MELVKLIDVKQGEKVCFCNIDNMQEDKHKRLMELGFVSGTKIEVLKKTKGVSLVGLRGFAVALDKEILSKIKVWKVG